MPIEYTTDTGPPGYVVVCDECGRILSVPFHFKCDATRAAHLRDGRMLCDACKAEAPEPATPAWAVPGWWDEWTDWTGTKRRTRHIDEEHFNPHVYGPLRPSDCIYGCGCQDRREGRSGPVNPFGACPNNPRPQPEEDAVTEEQTCPSCVALQEELDLKPEEDDVNRKDLTTTLPTTPGVFLSCIGNGPIQETLVWSADDRLWFAPNIRGESAPMGKSNPERLWSAEPLAVGEAAEPIQWTKTTPAKPARWGTKAYATAPPEEAFVWKSGDCWMWFSPDAMLDPQDLDHQHEDRRWTSRPLRSADDLDSIPDEPGPVEELRSLGPFKAKLIDGKWRMVGSEGEQSQAAVEALAAIVNAHFDMEEPDLIPPCGFQYEDMTGGRRGLPWKWEWPASMLTAKEPGVSDKYHELLYAVEDAVPGETRHETALRLIRHAACNTGTGQEAPHA